MTPFKKDAADERKTSQNENQDSYVPRDPAWLRREPVKRGIPDPHPEEARQELKAS